MKTEELVSKRKNCTILGNADGAKIASTSSLLRDYFIVSLLESCDVSSTALLTI
jgi:hypothetical protein